MQNSELGGEDASVLTSTANTLAAVAVICVAPVGVLLRRLSAGSWKTQYYLSAALLLGSGLMYSRLLTTTPARTLLLGKSWFVGPMLQQLILEEERGS